MTLISVTAPLRSGLTSSQSANCQYTLCSHEKLRARNTVHHERTQQYSSQVASVIIASHSDLCWILPLHETAAYVAVPHTWHRTRRGSHRILLDRLGKTVSCRAHVTICNCPSIENLRCGMFTRMKAASHVAAYCITSPPKFSVLHYQST